MSRSCTDLHVRTKTERWYKYLETEIHVLLVGLPTRKTIMDLQSRDRRNPKFQRTLEGGVSHLKSWMETHLWQSEQGRWFLHEDRHHSWSRNTNALQTLESVSGAQVKTMKQFCTIMTKCHPIVEKLAASVKNHVVSSIAFATSVMRGLRRTLEVITGAVEDAEVD